MPMALWVMYWGDPLHRSCSRLGHGTTCPLSSHPLLSDPGTGNNWRSSRREERKGDNSPLPLQQRLGVPFPVHRHPEPQPRVKGALCRSDVATSALRPETEKRFRNLLRSLAH